MIAYLKSNIPPRTAIALAAMALLATVVMGRENPPASVVALATPATPPSTAAETATQLNLQKLGRSKNTEGVPDLFAPQFQAPPLAPAAVKSEPPSPPPAPAAPPLPFTYLGQYIDGERTEIFIARGDEHYTAEKGRTIEGEYRVEKITPTAVTFVYLPLGTRQTLAIPALK